MDIADQLNAAYRERAHLVALLTVLWPSVIILDGDPDAPGWALVYIDSPTGQLSWHLSGDDLDLFPHVPRVETSAVTWDNHTTEEKYQRIRQQTAEIAEFPMEPFSSSAEQRLARLHEGEQPLPEDENVELTPAQMLWRWNRATPADRLKAATYICTESYKLDRYETALQRIAARCESRRGSGNCTPDCHSEVARVALAAR